MKKQVAICHFNTPELTEATILSLRKHGGNYPVTIFDNSTTRPFVKKMEGVTIIDNTQGQIIDFDKELAKFPHRCTCGTVNNYGSVKHMMSVQKLFDLLPDGFLLMDSDILLKADIDFMFQSDQCAVGHVQTAGKARNMAGIDRLVPMLCYLNVPLLKSCGINYFDPNRCWMTHSADINDRLNWYDTGASLLEDIRSHRNGARGRRIDIRPLMDHFQRGSWRKSSHDCTEWLESRADLWRPTPKMRGIKDVAICAIGRCENRYMVEWLAHYLSLGVKKIFLYDNAFGDEEKMQDLLNTSVSDICASIDKSSKAAAYTEEDVLARIELINLYDRQQMQCRAYDHCYRLHGNEYAWIGFFDFDELLRIEDHEGGDLPDVLDRYDHGDVLLVNWRIMTDNGLTFYDPRPMSVRFTTPMPTFKHVKYDRPENEHVKCFVRGGLKQIEFHNNPHCPSNDLEYINPSGKKVRKGAFAPIDWSVLVLDHYFTKTAEEWMNVKLKRGYHGNAHRTAVIIADQEKRFFNVNEYTETKAAIVRGTITEEEMEQGRAEHMAQLAQATADTARRCPDVPCCEGDMPKKKKSKPKTALASISKRKK